MCSCMFTLQCSHTCPWEFQGLQWSHQGLSGKHGHLYHWNSLCHSPPKPIAFSFTVKCKINYIPTSYTSETCRTILWNTWWGSTHTIFLFYLPATPQSPKRVYQAPRVTHNHKGSGRSSEHSLQGVMEQWGYCSFPVDICCAVGSSSPQRSAWKRN
jgi:hypothetical protein